MIYLFRHGQTEFNRELRFQGHLDSPLTDLGVAQAGAMGRLLAGLIPDPSDWQIIVSPLGRAQATARIVGDAVGIAALETEPRLIEITIGRWDGRLRSEVELEAGPNFSRSGWSFSSPDGETYDSTSTRTKSWLDSLPPEPNRHIIAVTHGVTSRILRGVYAGLKCQDTLAQPAPQDAIFALSHGTITRIACEPVA
jgi:broad specificity phosphatase PhoE